MNVSIIVFPGSNCDLDIYNSILAITNTKPKLIWYTESIPIKNKVDFVLLSAVYEHLLPTERKKILKMCWKLIKKDGVIFINQTPNRWVIYENHTTNLFLINYLPDKLCHWVSKNFSKRNLKKFSWNQLLRMGIRGGTENEITKIISKLKVHPLFVIVFPEDGLLSHHSSTQ